MNREALLAKIRALQKRAATDGERKAARRARREAERARKRERRLRDCTLENVADLENLYDAAMKAKKGIAWKASTQRYHKDLMLNLSKARSDLMEGRDLSLIHI